MRLNANNIDNVTGSQFRLIDIAKLHNNTNLVAVLQNGSSIIDAVHPYTSTTSVP